MNFAGKQCEIGVGSRFLWDIYRKWHTFNWNEKQYTLDGPEYSLCPNLHFSGA